MVLYLAAAQAIYNFALRPRGINSSVEFCDALCTCKLRAVKYGESWSHKPTAVNFDLDFLDLRPFRTTKKLLFINFQCVVCAYTGKFIFELTIFCWIDKMSLVHIASFCNLIGTTTARCWKLTNFSHWCYQPASPLLRREPVTRLLQAFSCMIPYKFKGARVPILQHIGIGGPSLQAVYLLYS